MERIKYRGGFRQFFGGGGFEAGEAWEHLPLAGDHGNHFQSITPGLVSVGEPLFEHLF